MRSRYFSHAHVRTAIGIFGALFNRIYIARFDKTGTKIDKLCHVPILYVPRSKIYAKDWFQNQESNKDIYEKFFGVYPRISYEFAGMSYRPAVQLQKAAKVRSQNQFGGTPVPYILNFNMNISAIDNLTALQVLEQIIPYFKPSYVAECDHEVFDNLNKDIRINLVGINLEDNYGDYENSRTVTYALQFEMEVSFFPYVKGADVELSKVGECGIEVEVPILELCPNPGEGGNDGEIIEKIIVDYHDMAVWPKFWPTIERDIITKDGVETVEATHPIPLDPLV
uniref:Tail sheath stabilizer n=1 Tax=Ochrobactrum phage ORM_20 TaxID=2985243 RepID=A0A9N6ZHS0_9VIRU|nr:tail sheath stabilizer [Ochrobactrum phage ORM_20]